MKLSVKLLFVLITVAVLVASTAGAGELGVYLSNLLSQTPSDQMVKTYIRMADRVDLPALKASLKADRVSLAQRHATVINALQLKAETTQQDLLSFLAMEQQLGTVADFRSMWIGNYVLLTATPDIVQQVAARDDVDKVFYDAPIVLDEPIRGYFPQDESRDDEDPQIRMVEAGLLDINAHLLWAEGITGEGRLVCNLDTGVYGSHPALVDKWRGNNGGTPEESWLDLSGSSSFPTVIGGSGHGTHTMGTMCGSNEATGDTVGVAIGAQWIAIGSALTISSIVSDVINGFQWAADPDGDPNTMDDVPDALNNSWGLGPSTGFPACYDGFNDAIDGVEAAGTAVIFSAGNSGPGAGTLTEPKNRIASEVNVLATAALDPGSTTVASFSSRGPSLCELDPGQPDSLLVKPEVAARGVNVRSSVPGGGYESDWSGTSMAAPHVAGSVALLRQLVPEATPEEIKFALVYSAVDIDAPGNDNNTGHGRIDVFEASRLLGGGVEGYVSLDGALDHSGVKIWSSIDTDRFAYSDSSGFYKIKGLSEGTHSLLARHQGYFDTHIDDIEITLGETVLDVNFAMSAIGQTPQDLAAESEISQLVPLSWTAPADEPVYYNVYRSTIAGGPYDLIGWQVPETSFDDADVTNGRPYYYAVTAVYENPYGESFYSTEAMAIPGERYELPLMDDFESPESSLYEIVIDPGNGGAIWEHGQVDPAHGPGGAASGDYVWAVGTADDYANNVDAYLMTELLDLTEVESPVLSFDHWYEFEATTTGQALRGFDGGNVAVSSDAGDTWIIVEPVDGYDDQGVPGLDQEAGFTGSSDGWASDEFDLSQFNGFVVTVRFRVGADAGVNMAGWFIDNLLIIDEATAIEADQVTTLAPRLAQNYPNPFNPVTTIAYQIPSKQALTLQVYNTAGQLVRTLLDDVQDAGAHQVVWDGRNDRGEPVSSGVYFYRLQAGAMGERFTAQKKMILLK